MTDFAAQVKSFAVKAMHRSDRVFQESSRSISYAIAEKSPVSTGRFLGSWSPSINTMTTHTFVGGPSAWGLGGKNEGIASANRSRAMSHLSSKIEATAPRLTISDTYYFANSTPYSQNVEYTGWQNTGPYSPRTQAVNNWSIIVREAVGRIG